MVFAKTAAHAGSAAHRADSLFAKIVHHIKCDITLLPKIKYKYLAFSLDFSAMDGYINARWKRALKAV